MSYPSSLDNLPEDKTNTTLQRTVHPELHNDTSTAVNAIETELGTNPSGSYPAVVNRLNAIEALRLLNFRGTWNANTNSPTLANGAGTLADAYVVSVAGTTNFGAGGIAFVVGDVVAYNGTIWTKMPLNTVGLPPPYYNLDGDGNYGLGATLPALTTGIRSTAVGEVALNANTSGDANTAIGQGAMNTNTTGSANAAVGTHALFYATTAIDNVALGNSAAENLTTGSHCVAIGEGALYGPVTGDNNIAIGQDTMLVLADGYDNIGIGRSTLASNVSGYENLAIGTNALENATGQQNVAIGHIAGLSVTSALGLAIVGARAANAATTADNLTAIGAFSAYGVTTGDHNVGVGYAALAPGGNNTTTGQKNTAIGTSTGQASATQRSNATALGYAALFDADYGVALGANAQALHARSVAIGGGSSGDGVAETHTSAVDQLRVAGRHIEMDEVSAPGAGAANTARLYAVDNGAGKTQLAVIFSSGAVQVLATQP